jgi:hypothetical protein
MLGCRVNDVRKALLLSCMETVLWMMWIEARRNGVDVGELWKGCEERCVMDRYVEGVRGVWRVWGEVCGGCEKRWLMELRKKCESGVWGDFCGGVRRDERKVVWRVQAEVGEGCEESYLEGVRCVCVWRVSEEMWGGCEERCVKGIARELCEECCEVCGGSEEEVWTSWERCVMCVRRGV